MRNDLDNADSGVIFQWWRIRFCDVAFSVDTERDFRIIWPCPFLGRVFMRITEESRNLNTIKYNALTNRKAAIRSSVLFSQGISLNKNML